MSKVSDFNQERLNRVERRLDELTIDVRELRAAQAVEAEKSAGRDLTLAQVNTGLVRIMEKLERMEKRLEIND